MQVLFKLLHPKARLPERGHGIDVGLDVFVPEEGILRPGPNKVPLGFSMNVPVGYSASIYPRSGMASGEKTVMFKASPNIINHLDSKLNNLGSFYENGVAILAQLPPIDPGYTGEVHAIILNSSDLYIKYPAHTRFGQLVVHPIVYVVPVPEIDTSREAKAFGSTGIGGQSVGIGD